MKIKLWKNTLKLSRTYLYLYILRVYSSILYYTPKEATKSLYSSKIDPKNFAPHAICCVGYIFIVNDSNIPKPYLMREDVQLGL